VIASGTRAGDAALRLKYAGVDPAAIEVVPDIAQALDRLAALAAGGTGYVLPTYTAMLELQRVAAGRGLARPYWEEAAA
jgi:lipid II isoglutaminyl synthase (glutamine-hydrolysing)